MKATRHETLRTTFLLATVSLLFALCVLPASGQHREAGPRIRITGILVSQGVAPPLPEDENERYPDDRASNYDHIRIRYETYVPRTSIPFYHKFQVNMVSQFLSFLLGNPVDRTYEIGAIYDTLTPPGLNEWEYEIYARPKSTILMMGSVWRYMWYHYTVDAYLMRPVSAPESPVVGMDTDFSVSLWRKRITPFWTMMWDDEPIDAP